jgi:glucose dehydrogenase
MNRRSRNVLCSAVRVLVVGAGIVLAGASLRGQVTFDRILRAASEPQNWLTYSGNVQSHRHSLLTQVTPANVKNLELQWTFQALSLEKFEATPIALDGVLYTVQAPNDIVALDGASGRTFWTYSYRPAPQALRSWASRFSWGRSTGT